MYPNNTPGGAPPGWAQNPLDGSWYQVPQVQQVPQMQQAAPQQSPPPTGTGYGPPYASAQPPQYQLPPGAYAQPQGQQTAPPQQMPWQTGSPAQPWGAPVGGDTLASEFPQGLDFNDPAVSGSASLPLGDHLVRFDDFEFGESKATPPNPKVAVKVTITHGQHANRSGIYSYTLIPKAIFKLGKDLQKLNLGLRPSGARWSTDPRTLAGELMQELRGRIAKIRVSDQVDRKTGEASAQGYVDVIVLGWPDDSQNPPGRAEIRPPSATMSMPASGTSGAPVSLAPPTTSVLQATYPQPNAQPYAAQAPGPQASPSNGTAAFHNV